jgi:XTP/dITP diphosphohydrolase
MQPRPKHAPPEPLIIATGNPGKLREFRALLDGLPYRLTSLGELGITSPEETGATFLDNAVLKARHAALHGRAGAIADDSGLEVDMLDGAPGVRSARYAGAAADDAANNAKLMQALRGVPPAARTARYRCVLAWVRHPQDTAPLIAEGVWEGVMLDAPRGTGGFGYDPYFFLPDLERSAAQLDPALKNRLSHRGRALRALRQALQ